MQVTRDGNGKHIIDFEGVEMQVDSDCSVNKLFNCDTVSEIKHGKFIFPHDGGCTPMTEGLPIISYSSFIGENKE